MSKNSVKKNGFIGRVEDIWGKMKEALLNILISDIGKMAIEPRNLWITKVIIIKMEERSEAKTTNVKEYRMINNQMRRETDRAKEVYMEELCGEIMDLLRKGRYDLMYQKAQQIEGRTSRAIRQF